MWGLCKLFQEGLSLVTFCKHFQILIGQLHCLVLFFTKRTELYVFNSFTQQGESTTIDGGQDCVTLLCYTSLFSMYYFATISVSKCKWELKSHTKWTFFFVVLCILKLLAHKAIVTFPIYWKFSIRRAEYSATVEISIQDVGYVQ